MAAPFSIDEDVYDSEFIMAHEKREPRFIETVTRGTPTKGGGFVFSISNTDGVQGSSRSPGGELNYGRGRVNSVRADLKDCYVPVSYDEFEIFKSAADLRKKAIDDTTSVLSRKRDAKIIEAFNQATLEDQAAAAALTPARIDTALKILTDNEAIDGSMMPCGALTPAGFMQLKKFDEFSNADFIVDTDKPYANPRMKFNWNGVHWIIDTQLPGRGTANSNVFIYTKDSIGYESTEPTKYLGWEGKHDLYNAWAKVYHDSVLLLETGVVRLPVDDTAS